jgi:gamma-glutamyltranspeptidase / glutathione hydrolase / leukotriene-C4 hydrolase
MDDFSYPQRNKNYFDLEETSTNYPEPGKRALSSMSPSILIDSQSGEVLMVIGAAGGPKIISTISVAILRYLCCTKNVKEIVDAPRFHHQLLPDEVEYEYGMIKGIIEGLISKGHKMKRYQDRGTIVNALTKLKNDIQGISDYRKDWSGVSGF